MKERKTMRLASLLLVCVLLCGMLATFASAAGAPRATYVLNVTTSAATISETICFLRFRGSPPDFYMIWIH